MSRVNRALRDELLALNEYIDVQLEEFDVIAARRRTPSVALQSPDGSFLVAPLLAAKAQVLSSLVALEGPSAAPATPGGVAFWPANVCPGGRSSNHHKSCRKYGEHDPHEIGQGS